MNETRARLLRALADGRVHSGDDLGAMLGVSRAAVSKSLRTLGDCGLALHQQAGRGYWLEQPLELLQPEAIDHAMGADCRQRFAKVRIELVLASTNNTLRESAAPAEPAFTAVLAEFQTAGRGRRGREWTAPLGSSILLSIAQTVSGGIGRVAGLSLVVGLAVRRALTELGVPEVGLKWPNDVYVNDAKLAGVLVELDGDIGGSCQWVAGIGLNWRLSVDPQLDRPWIDLFSVCGAGLPSRNRLAGTLLRQLVMAVDQLAAEGLGGFITEWREADILTGREVAIVSPGAEPLRGQVHGIDEAGALLLDTAQGRRVVQAGSVEMNP